MEPRPSPAVPDPGESAPSVAEDLPELYRTILERVAELERTGARTEAGRIRAGATRAYSEAWDESARRELTNLLGRADRTLAAETRHRTWWPRRRAPATPR